MSSKIKAKLKFPITTKGARGNLLNTCCGGLVFSLFLLVDLISKVVSSLATQISSGETVDFVRRTSGKCFQPVKLYRGDRLVVWECSNT